MRGVIDISPHASSCQSIVEVIRAKKDLFAFDNRLPSKCFLLRLSQLVFSNLGFNGVCFKLQVWSSSGHNSRNYTSRAL